MIEAGLYDYLINDSNINALVSGRVYPIILPQNAVYPCITYRRSGDDRNYDFAGQTGFVAGFIDIDAWGDTFSAAKGLQKTILTAIKNYKGLMGTVTVDRAFISASVDVYEDSVEKYRCSLATTIWFKE